MEDRTGCGRIWLVIGGLTLVFWVAVIWAVRTYLI